MIEMKLTLLAVVALALGAVQRDFESLLHIGSVSSESLWLRIFNHGGHGGRGGVVGGEW